MADVRIQPRQYILDVWASAVNASFRDGTWTWGGRDGSNSVSDAEQLLCLLYPAIAIESLTLDRPDAIADDVLSVLRPLGDSTRIPRVILGALADYITRYTDATGEPVFTGGSYLRSAPTEGESLVKAAAVTAEQSVLEVVNAYSMSVTLCLAALGFIQVFQKTQRRPEMRAKIEDLGESVSTRLTAAMVGLLRSFVVNTIEADESAGKTILGMVNPTRAAEPIVREKLLNSLSRIRERLREDVQFGLDVEDLDGGNKFFECGWSWGIASKAPPIAFDFVPKGIAQRAGIAEPRPYLYFTVVALDGINDLLSVRTRELALLSDDQRRLAEALQVRWELAQGYWSTIARFGEQVWPLEDIPWRTSDGQESDYYSLLVSAVVVEDLKNRRATDDDLTRAVAVFEELGHRGRITRRVTQGDPAVALHVPGVLMRLVGSEGLGPQLYWTVADFAPLLLKRTLQAAQLSANVKARDRLMRVAEAAMDHLEQRRLDGGEAAGLWDDPAQIFFPRQTRRSQSRPSWCLTERVLEGLVVAAATFAQQPLRTSQMIDNALEVLSEADHLFNQELLQADADDKSVMSKGLSRIEATLGRARLVLLERPATANALALEALRELDELAGARLDAARSF